MVYHALIVKPLRSLRKLFRRSKTHNATSSEAVERISTGTGILDTNPTDSSPLPSPPQLTVRTATELVKPTIAPIPSPVLPSSLLAPSPRRNSESSSQHSQSGGNGSSTESNTLRDQLVRARVECYHHFHSFFIPRCRQKDLITVSSVSIDLRARNPNIGDELAIDTARKVCDHATQLYATLAYIKKGPEIVELLKEGICDIDLPFVRKPSGDRLFALERQNGQQIKTMDGWSDKYREKFDRVQLWMTTPIFELGEHYELNGKALLPFIPSKAGEKMPERKRGGYSEVYPVRIHPSHHTFWPHSGTEEDEPLVAIKHLFSDDEAEFQKEQSILQQLGRKSHPHLIKLLATYKQNDQFHLMFPYADGNLRKYWEERPLPPFNEETVEWSLVQMTGIASALVLIHNFTVTIDLNVAGAGNVRMTNGVKLSVKHGEEKWGRHGDIKPENVLWFHKAPHIDDKMGVLQIADFGLGRFHGRDSRSRVDPETVAASPTYEPPECKLRKPVSRAYDIWSLGCLYLEFITWLLKGTAEIEGFSDFRGQDASTGINDDNFFTIISGVRGTKATVRQQVFIWVEELHSHEKCSALIHDLLDLTMQKLLVIDSKKRSSSSQLYQYLKKYLARAKDDKEYMLKPVPRMGYRSGERVYSTPAASEAPTAHSRRHLSYADVEKREVVTVIGPNEPKDLLLRKLGTPAYKPQNHHTWPQHRMLTG